MITGIYKITNKINNQSYIGLSKDIEQRIKTHFTRCYNRTDKEYDKALYRAIRKYGKDNFYIEVLCECETDELFEKERYYIKLFNTYRAGYNETEGGEGVTINSGEKHPKHRLTETEVIDIRNRYANHERRADVYQLYKNKISLSGFIKVWQGNTWSYLHMDVYTKENKDFHAHNTGNVGDRNGRRKLVESEVYYIRTQRKNGANIHEIYKQFEDKITFGSFENVWNGYNWKHVIV